MENLRTYYLESLGCAKNQVDSEVIIESLNKAEWQRVTDPALAKLIIVNTCGFIESAREESINVLISFRDAFPDAWVVSAGCLSQRYYDELAESMPELDGIFGNSYPGMVSEFVERLGKGNSQKVFIPEEGSADNQQTETEEILSEEREQLLSTEGSAYIKLAEGCSNNCSFCAIPIIRGPVKSRSIEGIEKEARNLVARGIYEINLIAQDLGSFAVDTEGQCKLPELLSRLDAIEGDFIIRMLYIHPDNFPEEILEICKNSRHIVPYFDIPFQHASEQVLEAMNRRGNPGKYLYLINKIRTVLPEAVIRTTFMLGFPGETPEDLEILETFIKDAKVDWAGFFVYSREEGTAAYSLENQRKIKKTVAAASRQLEHFQQVQQDVSEEAMKRFRGQKMRLLVEERVEKENLFICRAWLQAPEVDGLVVLNSDDVSLKPGDTVSAVVTAVNGLDLEADTAE